MISLRKKSSSVEKAREKFATLLMLEVITSKNKQAICSKCQSGEYDETDLEYDFFKLLKSDAIPNFPHHSGMTLPKLQRLLARIENINFEMGYELLLKCPTGQCAQHHFL